MSEQNRLSPDMPYHPIKGINIDSNGISAEELECIDSVNCVIYQSKVEARKGSTKLAAGADPTETILEYHRYVDPDEGSVLFAFCANTIWRYVSSAVGWVDVSNGLASDFNFTQWSITSAISDEVGATVVAAGSIYTRPNDSQTGGSGRLLLYFDRVPTGPLPNGQFKVLPLANLLPIVEEDTTKDCLNGAIQTGPELGASDNLNDNYDPDFSFYEPGRVVFSTEQSGVIATSGIKEYTLGGGTSYRLIPTNIANINYNDDSFVRQDGSSWSISFNGNAYNGERIFVSYVYGATDMFYPTYVAFYHNSLIFANTYEEGKYQPWRLRWTEPGDIYKTQALNYIDVAVGDITPILDLRVVETVASSLLNSFLYIYKQNSLVRAGYNRAYNTDPDIVAPLLELDEAYSEGVETVRTLEVINGQQIYLGRNDIYAFNGSERQSLTLNPTTGASRIREYIFDNIDLDNLNNCFSVYDEIGKRYILFIKFLSDIGDYPTNAFALDMERGTWSRYRMPETSAALAADITPNASIDSLPGNIEDLEGNIENLAGNSSKLVLLAMTQESFIQGIGPQDKTDDLLINFTFDTGSYPKKLYPQDTLTNGRRRWLLAPGDTSAFASISWDGAKWVAASGAEYTTSHPTGTDMKPPETGWDFWYDEVREEITTSKLSLTYSPLGEDFDTFFLTRDFVGGTLENQDRTQQVFLEGSRGSIELSYNTDYSLHEMDFIPVGTRTIGVKYKRVTFSPDVTANNIRFLVRLKDGAIFRWMQVFSIRQDMTNL